jgi:hypothetical protein
MGSLKQEMHPFSEEFCLAPYPRLTIYRGGVQNIGGVCIFSEGCASSQIIGCKWVKKEVEPYNWASISVLFLNWNTIMPSWKTVAFSSKPTHSLSLQTLVNPQ